LDNFQKNFFHSKKCCEKNNARDAEAMRKKYGAFYYPGVSDVKEVLAQIVSR